MKEKTVLRVDIDISTGAAFDEPEAEVARILAHLSKVIGEADGLEQLEELGGECPIRDLNGNLCGSVSWVGREEI